jgi:hypothetical protein
VQRFVRRTPQTVGDSFEVELIAEPLPEGLDGPGRVIAVAVEPLVDSGLDAVAQWPEQRSYRQRRSGDRRAASKLEQE